MSENLPKFDNPPVVEAVLGVQFAPLPGFSSAHAGWFWRERLGTDWPTVTEARPVPDAFERFGEEQEWDFRRVLIKPAEPLLRSQFINADEERMVQVQNTRLHYNWRKRESDYPSYQNSITAFEATWESFREFCLGAGLGSPEPNQWEVTYINHVEKGELWSTAEDWCKVAPKASTPLCACDDMQLEDSEIKLRLNIGENVGRLHIWGERVRVGGVDGPEVMRLTLTARGSLSKGGDMTIRRGLDIGHSAIVRAFTDITSDAAHQYWRRRQ